MVFSHCSRFFRIGLIALAALIWLAGSGNAASLRTSPASPQPGDLVTLTVYPHPGERIEAVTMEAFDTKEVRFYPRPEGFWRAFVGLPFDRKAGAHPLSARVRTQNGEQIVRASITAQAREFPTQRITMRDQGTASTMNRTDALRAERRYVQSLMASSHPAPLWSGPWVVPAQGTPSSPYGRRRYINGRWWGQHQGSDIKAPTGTPVVAMNAGRVILSELLPTLRGECVMIDHGCNIFSLYLHLARRDVRVGEMVTGGQRIGTVGSTGFSTGPHLHFEVRAGWEPIDPYRVIARGINF